MCLRLPGRLMHNRHRRRDSTRQLRRRRPCVLGLKLTLIRAVCSTDRVRLVDTYLYDDDQDKIHREPYCVKFSLHDAGAPSRPLVQAVTSTLR